LKAFCFAQISRYVLDSAGSNSFAGANRLISGHSMNESSMPIVPACGDDEPVK